MTDWASKIMTVLGEQTGDDPLFWHEEADAIVAALGLEQLDQDVRATEEILRMAATTANSVADVGNALGFVRAIRERDEARQERDEAASAAKRYLDDRGAFERALREAQAKRDAARRELQQLRDEVGRIADWFGRMADAIDEGPNTERYRRYESRIRAALAGTQEQS